FDILFDAVQAQTGVALRDRTFQPGEHWSLAIAFSDRGRLSIHADRDEKEIVVDMYPFVPELERPLRAAIMSVFKSEPKDANVVTNNAVWAVRIR
ncbi:MAG: hypothetical protein AAF658_20025, partial [Myxococcota bacterium]